MTPQQVTCAIKDSLVQCNSDGEFRIATYCIAEFLLISDLSVDEMIYCLENASGDYVESDKCIDDMISWLKENYK